MRDLNPVVAKLLGQTFLKAVDRQRHGQLLEMKLEISDGAVKRDGAEAQQNGDDDKRRLRKKVSGGLLPGIHGFSESGLRRGRLGRGGICACRCGRAPAIPAGRGGTTAGRIGADAGCDGASGAGAAAADTVAATGAVAGEAVGAPRGFESSGQTCRPPPQ